MIGNKVTKNVEIHNDTGLSYLYGREDLDGSIRFRRNGDFAELQERISGVWQLGDIHTGGVIGSTFLELTDVSETSFSGQALKGIRVNSSETGIEFFTGSGLVEWGEIGGTLSDQTDLQAAFDLKTNQTDLLFHTSNSNIHIDWTNATDNLSTTGSIGATVISAGRLISSGYINTSGAGDDLWLGNITQSAANFRAYANGDLTLTGVTDFQGGSRRDIIGVAGDYNITYNDYTILVDASSGARTITLPSNPTHGQIFNIKCTYWHIWLFPIKNNIFNFC